MEEQLPASLSEGQITEFVENGEVLASEVIGDSFLPPLRILRPFQAIDEIDCIEEAAAQASADAAYAMAMARWGLGARCPRRERRLRCSRSSHLQKDHAPGLR